MQTARATPSAAPQDVARRAWSLWLLPCHPQGRLRLLDSITPEVIFFFYRSFIFTIFHGESLQHSDRISSSTTQHHSWRTKYRSWGRKLRDLQMHSSRNTQSCGYMEERNSSRKSPAFSSPQSAQNHLVFFLTQPEFSRLTAQEEDTSS